MKTYEVKSSAQQLMASARELTGISDIIDGDIEEPLERLLVSLNSEAQLSETGSRAMEDRLLRVLCNRLRMLRDFRQHPEISDQKIVRPLFLVGSQRTGSTKLHKMLAASGDFKYLRFWQGHILSLLTGNRDENPGQRIRETEKYIDWFNTRTPLAKLTHEISTHEPEEEVIIIEHYIFQYIMAFAFVPSYMQWVAAQDYRKQLRFLKQALQYLQWQFYDGDPRPWLLKFTGYPGQEAMLMEVFPDATLVATFRHPVNTMPSVASLIYYYQKAYSDIDRKQFIGQMMLEAQAMGLQQHIIVRDGNPELKFLDIGYSELTKTAESVVEKIYAGIGMNLSNEARQAMRTWEKDNIQHKKGVHSYTLQDYSLKPEQVSSRLSGYIERFSQYF